MLDEKLLGCLYLLLVDETHVSETAIGKLVDDGSTHEVGNVVIDECTDIGTNGGEKYYEIYIQITVSTGCFVGCRRYYHFRWEGDERTFDSHQ
jgi:hypothetical protein